jgi:response regulator of citrate/malate metabolism
MDPSLAGKLEGARIMIVEDDAASRMLLEHLARWQSVKQILVADTVASGLDQLKHSSVDLIFTDLHTPNGNGIDLVKAVRAGAAGTANIQAGVVAITGDARESIVADLGKAGVDAFLIKPVSSGMFVTRGIHAWQRAKQRIAQSVAAGTGRASA